MCEKLTLLYGKFLRGKKTHTHTKIEHPLPFIALGEGRGNSPPKLRCLQRVRGDGGKNSGKE